jgi:hypothetical protein
MTRISVPFLLILFACLSSDVHSQINKFERVYGGSSYDYGNSITQTYDKGYALTGSTSSYGNGSADGYILKIDSLGNAEWQKEYGNINIDQFYSIKETSDSGLIAAGYTNSFGSGGYDVYLVKTNTSGDTIWTKTIGGTDWDFAYSVQQTSDGGYIVAGGTYSFGAGSEDVYLSKLDAAGLVQWTKTYGGSNEDEARSVQQTTDGGYIITGFTKSFGNLNVDIYTIKTDSSGDTLWTNVLGQNGSDVGNSIRQNANGEYILAGSTQINSGINLAYIVKFNTLGDTVFTRLYGAPNDAAAYDICETADGNYLWVGRLKIGSKYNVYFFKTDQLGYYMYASTFGSTVGDDEGKSVELTEDHGFIVAGNTNSFNNGQSEAYVFKTDSAGVSSGIIVNNAIGIAELTGEDLSIGIYPNPASDEVTISYTRKDLKQQKVLISVYDPIGRLKEQSISYDYGTTTSFLLDTRNYPNGVYFINLTAQDYSYNAKLVIEH